MPSRATELTKLLSLLTAINDLPFALGASDRTLRALVHIAMHEDAGSPVSPGGLARLLDTDKTVTSHLLAAMQGADPPFIEVHDDPKDGRRKLLYLSRSGLDSISKLLDIMDGTAGQITK